MKKKNRLGWKYYILLVCTIAFIVLRHVYHNNSVINQVDNYDIPFLIFLVFLFIWPELKPFISREYLKRIKVGSLIEVELSEKLSAADKITTHMEEQIESIVEKHEVKQFVLPTNQLVENIEQTFSTSPLAALQLLFSSIERNIREIANRTQMKHNFSVRILVQECVKNSYLPKEFLAAFNDIWAIRNQITHGYYDNSNNRNLYVAYDIGKRLLSISQFALDNIGNRVFE